MRDLDSGGESAFHKSNKNVDIGAISQIDQIDRSVLRSVKDASRLMWHKILWYSSRSVILQHVLPHITMNSRRDTDGAKTEVSILTDVAEVILIIHK